MSINGVWKKSYVKRTFDEFKKFIAIGKVIDLAVGLVIGAAFTAVMQSLVKDIVNPLLGVFIVSGALAPHNQQVSGR